MWIEYSYTMMECETGIITETTDLRLIAKYFLQLVLQYHNLILFCTNTKELLVADTVLERLTTLGPSSIQINRMVRHREELLYQKN